MKPLIIVAAPGIAMETAIVAECESRSAPLAIARRCVDAADLIAAATSTAAVAAVVGPGLPRLSRDTVARITTSGIQVVGLVDEGDEAGERLLRQLDVETIVVVSREARDCLADIASRVSSSGREPVDALEAADSSGRVIAVWGPTGAPGRTTVAITLADELARGGTPTLLVDGDPYGGVVATALGIWDDTSGLAMACRRAETGVLDVPALAACARSLSPTLRVLSGLPRPQRWAELRPASLRALWKVCRAAGETTVIDCGFSLESDDDIGSGPRRNSATLTAIDEADDIIAVGAADPVGIARLVSVLPDLAERVGPERIRLVISKVRPGALGRDPQTQVRDALRDLAATPGLDLDAMTFIPDDSPALDACLRDGRTLAEAAPRSGARLAIMRLAQSMGRALAAA